MGFFSSDGGGTVRLGGVSYPIHSAAYVALLARGDPVILPPMSARATLTAPFELDLSFSALFLQDVGGVQRFPLVGSGTVTIELVPNPNPSFQLWEFSQATYEFSPVPEPTSLLLLGTGVLALATETQVAPVTAESFVDCTGAGSYDCRSEHYCLLSLVNHAHLQALRGHEPVPLARRLLLCGK